MGGGVYRGGWEINWYSEVDCCSSYLRPCRCCLGHMLPLFCLGGAGVEAGAPGGVEEKGSQEGTSRSFEEE